ncbi:S-layer family protein [Synechococcus sp. A15-60]|uniref:beta strand repeat-containing protein n=1 Tax=Synechococcus sp. A15-60 TaxID=1050655 RepID=UPI00185FA690|nr:Ig-like domain-containing protein [Synechococcus sp. A15-60]QNI49553.1 putative cadherin domain-containing protein [Synechococcus sp. A15-60]
MSEPGEQATHAAAESISALIAPAAKSTPIEAVDASVSDSVTQQNNRRTASDINNDSTSPTPSTSTNLNSLDSNEAQPTDCSAEELDHATAEPRITTESLQQLWHPQLQEWASEGELLTAANTALHLDSNNPPELLTGIVERLSQGLSSDIPPIEFLQQASMVGAAGAYAASEQTIYLNHDWVKAASETDTIKVLTEEYGHHLDALIHTTDTPGDEGLYFADLLTESGNIEDPNHYLELKDLGHITVNNEQIDAEFSQQNNSLEWIQVGNEINGSSISAKAGYAVSLSQDGTILAVGAPFDDVNSSFTQTNEGSVTVYQDVNGSWQQLGSEIEGASAEEQFGYSVSLSNDGTKLAVAALFANTANGTKTGRVNVYSFTNGDWSELQTGGIAGPVEKGRIENVALSGDGNYVILGSSKMQTGRAQIYQFSNNQWAQIGTTLSGTKNNDRYGYAVDISDDGSIIAVGSFGADATNASNSGAVNVYELIDNQWNEITEIKGEKRTDNLGYSVALSSDGTYLAVGARNHDTGGNTSSNEGYAQVYKRNGSSYAQIGQTLVGNQAGEKAGTKVSISDDGSRLAIGSGFYNSDKNNVGQARLYELQSDTWIQIGSDINGQNTNDLAARWHGLSLNGGGTRVAVGAHNNDNNARNSGQVRIFDSSGITIAQTSTPLVTTEGGTSASFTVVLDAQPTDTVTVAISGDDSTEHELSASSLTFTTANWDTPQTITVTGVDDSLVDGDITTTITATASNTGSYAGTETATATLQTTDDDTDDGSNGVTITQGANKEGADLLTSEAGITSTFTVVLDAQPTDTVTVSITGIDATENSLSGSTLSISNTLTFTTANWDTAQTITVTGVDDSFVDGDITTTITATASNTGGYAGTESASTTIKNSDDEVAGITIAQASTPLVTTEAGSTATFTVVLDAQPTDTVTVAITGNDTSENSLSGSTLSSSNTLTFTTSDWNTPQTVTIAGVDDGLIDGDITTTLTATASNTGGYAGTESATTTVKNDDNDNPPALSNQNIYVLETVADGSELIDLADSNTSNDTDQDDDPIRYSILDGNDTKLFTIDSETGKIYLATNKTLNYTTSDRHELQIKASSTGGTSTATITIYVQNVNSTPVAEDDSGSLNENEALSKTEVEGLIANDSDEDVNDTLSISNFHAGLSDTDSPRIGQFNTALDGIYGQLTLQTNGSYTYTANKTSADALNAGETGTDTFSYTLSDSEDTDQAELTITIAGINDIPFLVDAIKTKKYIEGQGNVIVIDGSLDIRDVDDENIESATVSISNGTYVSTEDQLAFSDAYGITGNWNSSTGVLTLSGTTTKTNYISALQTVTYTNTNNANPVIGTRTIDWLVNDGDSNSTSIQSSIIVGGRNDAPLAVNDSASVDGGSTVSTSTADNLLVNDTDPESHSLSIKSFRIGSEQSSNPEFLAGNTLTGSYGQMTIASDGTYSYTAQETASYKLLEGETATETFTYTITDNQTTDEGFDTGEITITISGVNDAPNAIDDSVDVDEDSSKQFADFLGILKNDTDIDGDQLFVKGVIAGASTSNFQARRLESSSLSTELQGTYGVLIVNSNGSFRYTASLADALDAGDKEMDRFTYTLTDLTNDDSGVIAIEVTGINDTPLLSSITTGTISDQTNSSSLQTSNISGQLSATDADASAVLTYGISGASGSTASGTYGTLALNSTTGAYQYSPNSSVIEALNAGESVSDSFEIYVSDGSQSTAKTFQINITGANDASTTGSNTSNKSTESQTYGLTIVASGIINRAGQLITTEEGTSSSFSVVLNRQPSADVDVLISGLDSTEGRLNKNILRFTPSNWNVPQTVTVTGINDRFTDGDTTYNLTATANEAGGYSGNEAATITIKNVDHSNPQPSQLVMNSDDEGLRTTGDTGLWVQLEVLQANADLHNSLQIINDQEEAIGSIGATRNSTNMGKQEFFLSGGRELFFHQLSHDSKLDKSPSLRINSSINDFILNLDDSKEGDNDHDDLSIKITTSQSAKNPTAAILASEQKNIYDSILNLSEINTPTAKLRITIQSNCADVNKVGLVKIISNENNEFSVNGVASTAGESFDQAIRDNLVNPDGSELLINGLSTRQVEWNINQGEEGFYAPVFINQNTNDLFTFGATSAADNQIHVKNLGSNFFGYEDTLSSQNSDWDFNDITMLVEMI